MYSRSTGAKMIAKASEQSIDYERKLLEVRRYAAGNMKDIPYHNFVHVIDVRNAARRLARSENLSSHSDFLLETAVYLHDIIYETGAKNNEERSAEVAQSLLGELGYKNEEIEQIKRLILATKLPTNPQSHLEQIMCDADVDNLGREDFFEKCELLGKEFGITDKLVWYVNTLKFLQSHQFYTQSARSLRQQGKERNMQDLKALIDTL